jgi:LemA protein
MIALVFVLVLGGAILIMAMTIYNNLIGLSKQVDRAWANIDVILKQRNDEISSLIQVVEQFANYEKKVIDQLSAARANYGRANNIEDKIQASQEMSLALKGVFAIGENYPELRSSESFKQLQSRISTIEESLSDRREGYNETVTNYNTRILHIPDVFFAGFLGYREKPLFRVSEVEKEKPSLKMNL